MKSEAELLEILANFTGTEQYHRFSALFRNVLLTDGAKALADECQAYWLIDVIASHIPKVRDTFCVVTLKRRGGGATITLADDTPSTKTYARQRITYTDFPLQEIKLYLIRQDGDWVIELPSEY